MARVKYARGQSILEYVLVITVIIGVILFAAVSYIKPAVNKTLTDADIAIKNVAEKF
jgi:hypothetical protein